MVGIGAVKYHDLLSVEQVVITGGGCAGADIGQFEPTLLLQVGEGALATTVYDFWQVLFLELVVARFAQQAAKQQHRGDIGLYHQALAEFFDVPPSYFFRPEYADEKTAKQAASIIEMLRDPAFRMVGRYARSLSLDARALLSSLIGNLKIVELSGEASNGHVHEQEVESEVTPV